MTDARAKEARDVPDNSVIVDISVIVPVYNTLPDLVTCLDSLVGQSIASGRLEVITVDDGSTDGSGETLDRYAAEHPGLFRVVHQENSGGPARPCNVGLDIARGRFVFFLGSDDYLDSEAAERMVVAADRWGSDVLCARLVGVNGRWVNQRLFSEGDQAEVTFPSEDLASALSNTKLFRRELLERHGIRYDHDLRVGSDQPFVIEAMSHARRISVLADRPYYYAVRRDNAENITYSSTWRQRLQGISAIMDHVARVLPPGPERDTILQRHLSGEVATILRRDFAEVGQAERSELAAAVNQVTAAYLTEPIRRRLKLLARLRYDLAAAGDLEALAELAGAEDSTLALLVTDDAVFQAPLADAGRITDDRFSLPAESMPATLWASLGDGCARLEGSVLVVEGSLGVLPASGDRVRGWLAPAEERVGWGARSVPRVQKWPPRSRPLQLAEDGSYTWRLDLAPLPKLIPGTAWALRIEIDALAKTWRLPLRATLDGPASFTRDGQTIRMRALPDDDGRLVFELLDAKDPHG